MCGSCVARASFCTCQGSRDNTLTSEMRCLLMPRCIQSALVECNLPCGKRQPAVAIRRAARQTLRLACFSRVYTSRGHQVSRQRYPGIQGPGSSHAVRGIFSRLRIMPSSSGLRAFFWCLYYCAMRPGEAARLRQDDFELPNPDGERWLSSVLLPTVRGPLRTCHPNSPGRRCHR